MAALTNHFESFLLSKDISLSKKNKQNGRKRDKRSYD